MRAAAGHRARAAGVAGAGAAHEAKHAQPEERLPTIGAAPDFALTSQDGAEVTLAALRGKVVAVDVHLHLVPRRLPDAHRQDGAGAGRAGVGFRQQGRLRLDHHRSGARHARGAERSTPRRSRPTSPAGASSPASRRRCSRWRTATAWRWRKAADGQVDHTLLTTLIDRQGTMRVQYLGYRFDRGGVPPRPPRAW